MDNQNYQDEFEQFLQDEVKQHRMYPSDHIWNNIRTEIHGQRSWPALSFIALFIITTLTLSTLLINHPSKYLAQAAIGPLLQPAGEATGAPEKENYFTKLAPERVTAATLAKLEAPVPAESSSRLPDTETAAITDALTGMGNKGTEHIVATNNTRVLTARPSFQANAVIPITTLQQEMLADTSIAIASAAGNTNTVETATVNSTTETPASLLHLSVPEPVTKENTYLSRVTHNTAKRNSKIGIQVYLTPSTSYRRLTDEKLKEIIQPASASVGTPLNQHLNADVNNVVRHKPAIGLEFGFAVLYNMTDRLKFKTGVQLNIRQYYIETFQSLTNDLTTISLVNYRGIENVLMYSPYNNNVGFKPTQLDNKLYQVSVPLGLQWDILQGKHLGVNTEASVQPTFTLNKNVYLLSTDFRHYADGASFLRKWNVNTSVGLNFTYKTRGATIQLGPQIRYQHLPTYSNLYPIKEYLLDYGVRIGITKQLFK